MIDQATREKLDREELLNYLDYLDTYVDALEHVAEAEQGVQFARKELQIMSEKLAEHQVRFAKAAYATGVAEARIFEKLHKQEAEIEKARQDAVIEARAEDAGAE